MSISEINDRPAQSLGRVSSEANLREVAEDLEASFIAEMLKHAGFGEARAQFGGGAGEEQFASMLRNEHARAITNAGGIGLAEMIFESLVQRSTAGDQRVEQ